MTHSHHRLGWHNHSFMPTNKHGPIYCVWESRNGATLDDMQNFIDGSDGPGMGMMINTCRVIHQDLAGGPPATPFDFHAAAAAGK